MNERVSFVQAPVREYDGGTFMWHNHQAETFIQPGEAEVPEVVMGTVRNLSTAKIWFSLSRNEPSFRCEDAADNRNRLGNEGIPLPDELKTRFTSYIDPETLQKREVMFHCRADREVDYEVISRILGVDEEAFDKTRDDDSLGKINPFSYVRPIAEDDQDVILDPSEVLHIVDDDLYIQRSYPGTMMTNAGDRGWGVEFYPDELFDHIQNKVKAPISKQQETPRPFEGGLDPVYIITGNSPQSGITFLNLFLDRYNELLKRNYQGDSAQPPFNLISRPFMGDSMELDIRKRKIWRSLKKLIKANIKAEKPSYVVLADNTTDYFNKKIRRITDKAGSTFISTSEATASLVKTLGIKNVALLGVRSVAQSEEYSSFRKALASAGVSVENLTPEKYASINALAYKVKQAATDEGKLKELLDEFRETMRSVESPIVIAALTELTELFEVQKTREGRRSGKLYIDTMIVLADELARRCLGLPPDRAFYKGKMKTLGESRQLE